MSVNSRDYWEARFREDWDAMGGEAQSRFFAALAVDAMPAWFRARLVDAGMRVCDWGCAEGAGTALLADALRVPVTGMDFSAEAIQVARQRHPGAAFMVADVMEEPVEARFDVVFSSNTLEHFHAPWQAFDAIAAMAERYVVLLLPYREMERHPEHFVSFTPGNLPAARGGLVLVHAAVIDAAALPGSAWPGEQVFCVYARAGEIEAAAPSLAELRLDTPDLEARLQVQAERAARAKLESERLAETVSGMHAVHGTLQETHGALQEAHGALQETNGTLQETNATLQESNATLQEELARVQALAAQQASSMQRLALLEQRLPKLELDSLDLARIRNSRPWRWSAPLRLLKRVATGRTSKAQAWRSLLAAVSRVPVLGARIRRKLVHASRADAFEPAAAGLQPAEVAVLRPAPARAGKSDVFVWAVIDWHFRIQRPQHLARALAARGHRVFYMSNNLVDSEQPGFSIEPLDADARLFQVRLHVAGAPTIYHQLPGPAQSEALRDSLARFLEWAGTQASMSLVQHPFWSALARVPPNARRVYDCMDHHAGFDDNAPALIEAEHALVAEADLVVVTSGWLERELGARARATAVVRNAGEHAFFSRPPRRVFRDPAGRKVIGYYGAIAPWFDVDLVAEVARACPDALVLLIGADTAGAGERLHALPNVRMEGEVPYADLPYWLQGFDACLLPFKVIDLTLATNPVKVYEYLGAGKEVVAVDLPEMAQFDGLVRTATTRADFIGQVRATLADPPGPERKAALQAFAAAQTWDHRAAALEAALDAIDEPRVSVVVLAYNNLALTRACLDSIAEHSDYPALEVIVVDNASSDGTDAYLRDWAAAPSAGQVRRVISNARNLGFAAGNNVGLEAATGDYLVLLNNDTYVTPGWVRSLIGHLRADTGVGLVGPVTANIGNEAKIELCYDDMHEMVRLAGDYTRRHAGMTLPMATLAFFCVAMRREVLERVGGLDEAYGMGFFEDDDYCRRVAAHGWRLVCAEDVFVHHHLSASFNKLPSPERQALFERNKAIYEARWGAWQPHRHRAEGG